MLKAKTGNSILVCFVFFVVKNPCSSVIKPLYVFAPRNVPDLFCWQGHRAAMTGQHAVLALIAPGRRPALLSRGSCISWFINPCPSAGFRPVTLNCHFSFSGCDKTFSFYTRQGASLRARRRQWVGRASPRAAVASKPNGSSAASLQRAAGRGLPAPPL